MLSCVFSTVLIKRFNMFDELYGLFYVFCIFLFMFFSSPACALRMLERSDVEKKQRCYEIGSLACRTLQVATKLESFGDQVVS